MNQIAHQATPAPDRHGAAVEHIVEHADRLPTLSDVYHELVETIADPNHTAGRLSSIIARDLGLTTELFRLVNSAAFALGVRVESLPQAVSFVGTTNLRNLAAATSLMKADDRTGETKMRQLNQHSLATGALASLVRRMYGDGSREAAEAFTAGLLHEVGALVLARFEPEDAAAPWDVLDLDDPSAELAAFGADRFAVGSHLLRDWCFDEQTVGAIDGLALSTPIARGGLCGSLRLAHLALTTGVIDAGAVLEGDHASIRPVLEHFADEHTVDAEPA